VRRTAMVAVLGLGLATACGRAPVIETVTMPAGATGAEQGDPAVAVDPASGDVLLAWVSGDSAGYGLWVARSTDGGATWTSASPVVRRSRTLRPSGEGAPRLAVAGRAVGIAWSDNIPIPGRQWPATNLWFARSTDGGLTWSAPLMLNDDSTAAPGGHSFHGIAWQGDSGLVVAWLDERRDAAAMPAHATHDHPMAGDDHASLYVASSGDRGATWARTNRRFSGDVCPCCRVTLAREPQGRVVAAWRRVFPGNVRDVVVAPVSLLDSAQPTRVYPDSWVYPGCPDTGPGLAVGRDGATHVAWYTGKPGAAGVYYARRGPAASFDEPVALVRRRTLPTGHVTVAARADGGAVVAYDLARDGRHLPTLAVVTARGSVSERLTLDTLEVDRPQVAAFPDGTVLVAYVVTRERGEIRLKRVRLARSAT